MVLPVFRFMLHDPNNNKLITAAVQWRPIKARGRDPNSINRKEYCTCRKFSISAIKLINVDPLLMEYDI